MDYLKKIKWKEDGEEYIEEMESREDIKNIKAEDIVDVLLHTMEKDLTIEMMEENLEQIKEILQRDRLDRIQVLLFIKDSCDFKEKQEIKES